MESDDPLARAVGEARAAQHLVGRRCPEPYDSRARIWPGLRPVKLRVRRSCIFSPGGATAADAWRMAQGPAFGKQMFWLCSSAPRILISVQRVACCRPMHCGHRRPRLKRKGGRAAVKSAKPRGAPKGAGAAVAPFPDPLSSKPDVADLPAISARCVLDSRHRPAPEVDPAAPTQPRPPGRPLRSVVRPACGERDAPADPESTQSGDES